MKQEIFDLDLTNRKVNLIKIQRESVQGRHKHNRGGKNLHKTQAGKAATKWSVPVNKELNLINTGLWQLKTNPYYSGEGGEAKPLPSDWILSGVDKVKYITWQTYFEIIHNKPKGTYNSRRATLNELSADRSFKGSYLQMFRRRLIDGTNVLNLSRPQDQLMYFFALWNNGQFATSIADQRKNARALFRIEELNAPAEEKFIANVSLADTMANLSTLHKKFSSEIVKQFATILKVATSSESFETVYNALQNAILTNKTDGRVNSTFNNRFNELFQLLSDKKGRPRFTAMFTLQDLINNSVMGDSGGTYTWYNKKGTDLEIIGKSKAQAIAWLMDDEKAIFKQQLLDDLKARKLF